MSLLPVVWGLVIALALTMYMVFDGMDLGVGITLLRERQEGDRDLMVSSVAPVWDANETWIVLAGVGLFGGFSTAYGILLPAFYIPLVIMLLALAFRGAAFEFRFQSPRRVLWDRAFAFGSLAAAGAQGAILGGLLAGVAVTPALTFAGSPLDFVRAPVTLVTILAVPIGYAFLGSAWLVLKTAGPLRQRSAQRTTRFGLMFALIETVGVVVYWATHPGGLPVAHRVVTAALVALSLASVACALAALRFGRRPGLPFLAALAAGACGVVAVFASLWPMLVPPRVSLEAASSGLTSQRFLLVGVAAVLPIVLAYSAYAYYVFRGTSVVPDPDEGGSRSRNVGSRRRGLGEDG